MSPVQGAPEIPLAQILHGEQAVTLHGALPVTGTATFTGVISAVYDTGRHAVIESVAELRDAVTGDLLAETVSSMIVRGEGGFGGQRHPPPVGAAGATADVTLGYPTRRDQALLYRLSGDRNPLHSDPWFARSAGLERPILHGLCTYGFAGRALLHEVCGGDPDRFGSMSARFTHMVIPGDTLDIDVWRTTDGAVFRARVGDRAVLDRGTFRLRTRTLRGWTSSRSYSAGLRRLPRRLCPRRGQGRAPHLAGVVAQRLADAFEGARDLVRHEALGEMGAQLLVGHLALELQQRVRHLAEVLVGQRDDHRGRTAGCSISALSTSAG